MYSRRELLAISGALCIAGCNQPESRSINETIQLDEPGDEDLNQALQRVEKHAPNDNDLITDRDPIHEVRDYDSLTEAVRAAEESLGSVRLSEGVHEVTDTLEPQEPITLFSDYRNATIQAAPNTGNYRLFQPRSDEVHVKNILLDANTQNREGPNEVAVLGHVQNCHLKNVTMTNFGGSSDDPDGVGFVLNTMESAPQDTAHNIIEGLHLIDPEDRCQYPFRLRTDWRYDKQIEEYERYTRDNILRYFHIEGGAKDPLEIAGPATQHNLVIGGVISDSIGERYIDLDHGPSFNTVKDCVVTGHKNSWGDSPVGAIQIRGEPPNDHPIRWAEGNSIDNCYVSDIDGKNEITRGLYLQDYARSNQISVEIRNIDTDREGEINLNGAYIGELVEDTQITNSTFNVLVNVVGQMVVKTFK